MNGKVLFGGYDTSGKKGLWVTNGTALGTQELAGASGLAPLSLTAFNGEVLFNGQDAWGYLGLWGSDGTAAGTQQLSGIANASDRQNVDGTVGFNPSDFSISNGEVLFSAYNSHGIKGLWATNGTAAGTFEVISGTIKGLAAVSLAGNPPVVAITSSGGLTNQATRTVTGTATAGGADVAGAIVTLFDNGASIGTATVGSNGVWSANVTLSYGNNALQAAVTDAASVTGISTAVGYMLDTGPRVAIGSVCGAVGAATQTVWGTVTAAAGEPAIGGTVTLYDNGIQAGAATVRSDGTWAANVTLVNGANSITAKDTDAGGNTGTSTAAAYTLSAATAQNTFALFSGKDAGGDTGLWVTNGTAAGTQELTGISGAPSNFNPASFVQFGGKVYFAAADAKTSVDRDLWVTNGTAASTQELTPVSGAFVAGLGQHLNPQYLTTLGSSLVFSGIDGIASTELWVSDGTAAGTHELIGVQHEWLSTNGVASGQPPAVYGFEPTDLTAYNGKVLFAGYVYDTFGTSGLWVTNGTVAGTQLIADNGAYSMGLRPNDLTIFNNEVYFNGYDANFLHSLWVTDGTAAGTYEVVGIAGADTAIGVGLSPRI